MNKAEYLKVTDWNNMTAEEMGHAREYEKDEQISGRQEEIEQDLYTKYTDKSTLRQIEIDMHGYSNIKEEA